ncbi:hypothetical protein AVEN_194277-1 [Araneus ventricosus]|uniref:Uncharacterized protein n=1 Tax=Araneus ventricosus TaxID=182803 RepID=A0A4Y2G0H2_ARAVE|nr:hypothetical protein AVEN_194277-1 [Araneus ventricosus]
MNELLVALTLRFAEFCTTIHEEHSENIHLLRKAELKQELSSLVEKVVMNELLVSLILRLAELYTTIHEAHFGNINLLRKAELKQELSSLVEKVA